MLDLKMYPLLLTWLQSQNHSLYGMIDANYQKNRTALYHVRQIVRHDWSKPTEQKNKSEIKNAENKKLHRKLLDVVLVYHATGFYRGKFLSQTFRYFSAFSSIALVNVLYTFLLGQTVLDSYLSNLSRSAGSSFTSFRLLRENGW